MGYDTRYRLGIDPGQGDPINKIASVMKESYPWAYEAYRYEDEWKWYEHQEDMMALSRDFPLATFTLDGRGEDFDDVWRKVYLGGECRMQGVRWKSWDEMFQSEAQQLATVISRVPGEGPG